ncbi:MAG: hypothetical protein JWP66_665 [Naasia sp.]|nr:hypothetical protein [Naasia sp.]
MTAPTIAPLSPPLLRWTRVTPELTSGEWNGNYAGMIEHADDRYIATDSYGAVVGRFATEGEARDALHPDALERAWQEREAREARFAGVTALVAAFSAIIAAAGMLTLAGV